MWQPWGLPREAERGRAPSDRRAAGPHKPRGAGPHSTTEDRGDGPRATTVGLDPTSRVEQDTMRPAWAWAPEAE